MTNHTRIRGSRTSRTGQRPNPSLPASWVWLNEPISFVDHPAFHRRFPEQTLNRLAPLPRFTAIPSAETGPGLTFVAGFVSQPLLLPGEEESLFAWMNYHRFLAERLRRQALKAKSPRRAAIQIRRELDRANQLRNQIVASNLRLVVSVAKKLARSLDQMSELISEGVLPLIRAVELFDISLGNRFSTYATWAVRNQMLRMIKRSVARAGQTGVSEIAFESIAAPAAESAADPADIPLETQVHRLIAELPEREQRVLKARFGLAGQPAGQSLAEVAEQVGLSKERVRQIVIQSVEELRSRFTDPRGAESWLTSRPS